MDGRADVPECGGTLFIRGDGGYTSVAVALALLLSLALVVSLATAGWSLSRAADIQGVADAAAMAGANGVAAFATIAQVLDACVLSMGLMGVLVYGAGMVVAAIPFLQDASPGIMDLGQKILDARRDFAKSAVEGLERLERVLPAIVLANGASCISANAQGAVRYSGVVIPFPKESESDYSAMKVQIDTEDMDDTAEVLREATQRKEDAARRAREAKERGWRADNVDDPHCMWSRASSLAGLSAAENPRYASADGWQFGYALARAKNYYLTRWQDQAEDGSDPDRLQRSCARKVFYEYAYDELLLAVCQEGDDVLLDLPELAHSTEMVRACHLYTDVIWPCTQEGGVTVLHCSLGCPAATGASAGLASLSEIDSGGVARCDTCKMDARAMGNVADASTNIDNGFEHYWQELVESSRDYQEAKEDEKDVEADMADAAQGSASAFQEAMNALSVDRPRLTPPGSYGCIAIVMRADETPAPRDLITSFAATQGLPTGVAIAGATLAPDGATDGHNVLSSVFDQIQANDESMVVDLLDGVADLWGRLLLGYGSAYETVSSAAGSLLDGIGGVFGEKVASWLKGQIKTVVDAAGFEPADMRLRKPVLVNTQSILDKAGGSKVAEARKYIQSLQGSPEDMLEASAHKLWGLYGSDEVTIAEIPIPGLDGVSIPLTLNMKDLLEAM